ncbi:MAG: cyclopropane-fatty-acyl-phospholipid synthase family protein [Candidatus Deferrimicrobiaceae bacterium]
MGESTSVIPDRFVQTGLSILHILFSGCRPKNFAVRLWDGTVRKPEAGREPVFTLVINRPGALRRMFWRMSDLALGESYIYGDFDVEGDFESAFALEDYLAGLRLGVATRLRCARQMMKLPSDDRPPAGKRAYGLSGAPHSLGRDREAVRYHYDVSNDFFALWLDRRMVYSSAYFTDPGDELEAAQERKLDYICRKLRLRRGERLLDIGCGWGGLVIHAAKTRGVEAVGITLSRPQAELASARIREECLTGRCRVEVQDYREIDAPEHFDKIASVGMFEHVGESRLEEYFARAWRLLRPGGVFLNHGIAWNANQPMRPGPYFSDHYVFPDGDLVPVSTTLRAAERSGFEVRDVESLRDHYLITLRHWIRRLESRHEEARRVTDEVTCRVWRLYLNAAAYRFRVGVYNVYQSLLAKSDGGRSGMPLSRADWYS